MERLNDFADINKINCNKLYVNYEKSKIVNSNIVFNGKNNVLYVEDGVVIKNSTITFNKDNSLIYLSTSKTPYIVDCFVNFNNTIYVGRDCYFNDAAKMHFLVYENANIIIGNDGLFSFDIWLRTSDPHLIYDIKRKKRINYSKSIFVGDHVWLGQRCLILKGSQIGSGSVVGGGGRLYPIS